MRLAKRVGPAVALPLALAACGGGSTSTSTTIKAPGNVNERPSKAPNGQKTFSAPGMAIHFQYPAQFHAVALASSRRTAGRTTRATHSAVAIGEFDLLIVSRIRG